MTSESEVLFPEGKKVTVKGEEITLKPLTFGQIPKTAKLIGPIIKAMNDALSDKGEGDVMVLDLANDWVSVVANGGDELIDLMGYLINKERTWFDDLAMDDAISIVTAWIEVNGDFFKKKVMGKLAIPGLPVGPMSSPSSSETATPEQKSMDTPSDK